MRGPRGRRLVVDRRPQVAERAVRLGARLRPRRGGPPRGDDPRAPRTTSRPPARERDPYNWVPESSRRARGFAVLAALRSLGPVRAGRPDRARLRPRPPDGRAAVGRPARRDPQRRRPQPGARPVRGPGDDADGSAGDARTRAVIDAVQRDGTCWLGGTTWAGRAAMRISVSGWQTTEADIDAVGGRHPALPRRGRSRGR